MGTPKSRQRLSPGREIGTADVVYATILSQVF